MYAGHIIGSDHQSWLWQYMMCTSLCLASIRDGCNDAGHSLPVMMVSANSETKDVLKGLENGANDYIRKPFQREDLHMRVQVSTFQTLYGISVSWLLIILHGLQAHIHTMQQCDTEVEARMPWSLLHLSVTKRMEVRSVRIPVQNPCTAHASVVYLFTHVVQVELMNGADDVSISVPCAAVFYIMMQPLQADYVSESQQPDSGATRDVICSVMPMMQAHCSVNKMLFVQKWSTCLVFMTNPEVIAEEECIEEMHVFAENTMAMLIEVCTLSPFAHRLDKHHTNKGFQPELQPVLPLPSVASGL